MLPYSSSPFLAGNGLDGVPALLGAGVSLIWVRDIRNRLLAMISIAREASKPSTPLAVIQLTYGECRSAQGSRALTCQDGIRQGLREGQGKEALVCLVG